MKDPEIVWTNHTDTPGRAAPRSARAATAATTPNVTADGELVGVAPHSDAGVVVKILNRNTYQVEI